MTTEDCIVWNAICLTIYVARLCSQAPKATEFSLSMLGATLPIVLGVSGISKREIFRLTKKLSKTTQQKTLTDMYTKVRKAISPQYEMAMTMLEILEKYYIQFERHATKRRT